MVKIERPKSLFGRHPYLIEQHLIHLTFNEVEMGTIFVQPELTKLVGFELIPMELIKPEKRREKAREHFTRALKILENMGV